ncbi:MAG: DNA-3-methyladenine glycosylase [Ignavibacteriales bacterium]
MDMLENKLPKEFYTGNLLSVARNLLGKIFVKKDEKCLFTGRIVEVEAYDGNIDEAAHTFIGRTARNEIMFSEGGYLYVYFTYGMYFCCNIVTGNEAEGKAVLLRGIEPLKGITDMALNRYKKETLSKKEYYNLTSGPGKICQAFGISREHNGTDLLEDRIFLLDQQPVAEKDIVITTRIGITKSVDLPWRFYIKDNPFVSKK